MTTWGGGRRVPTTGLREHAEQQLTGTGLDLAAALALLVASTGPHGPANSVTAALTEGWHSADPRDVSDLAAEPIAVPVPCTAGGTAAGPAVLDVPVPPADPPREP